MPPKITVNNLINLYNKGYFKAVFEQTQTLTRQYPKVFMFWNILGACSLQLGKLEKAIEAYKNALSLSPNSYQVYSNLGIALKDQGKHEKAIEFIKKALKLNPNFIEAHFNMGIVYKEQNKLEDAIKAYKTCISLKNLMGYGM